MTSLLALLFYTTIAISLQTDDGLVECLSAEPVVYHPDLKAVTITCTDEVFKDGFENV